MSKEAHIPLFLWIATAVVAHILWGGGVDRVADVIEEGVDIREFAASVRRHVRGEQKPIEIALVDETETTKESEPLPRREARGRRRRPGRQERRGRREQA